MENIRIEIAGGNALIVYFGEKTDPLVSAQVQSLTQKLSPYLGQELVDMVPSYASLLIIFNPFHCDHLWLRRTAKQILQGQQEESSGSSKLLLLPAYYSEESGPDLAMLAGNAKLSIEDVIELHTSQEFRVYAIGFAPGFAYLGEVDKRIAAPRLSTPRMKVPKGAVAIADQQTAVYPAQSPGGWNLIGLCPTPMFDPSKDASGEPTMPVAVGDRIQFRAINREEFFDLGGELPNFDLGAGV